MVYWVVQSISMVYCVVQSISMVYWVVQSISMVYWVVQSYLSKHHSTMMFQQPAMCISKLLLRLSKLTYYNFFSFFFSAFITCVICCICQSWKLCSMYTFEIKFVLFCSVSTYYACLGCVLINTRTSGGNWWSVVVRDMYPSQWSSSKAD